VLRLVLELVLQLVQLRDGMLEAVVLQRGARVGGQRLEQGAVGVREAARQAEAVREHDRADHVVLAAQHAEQAVPDSPPLEVGVERLRERRRQRHRGVGARGARAQRGGCRRVHERQRLAGAARAEAGAQRCAAVGGEEDDLGLLGLEGLERSLQQALQRDGDRGRLGQREVGLVQELHLLVALALLDVRAVADEGDQDRDQQQRRGLRPLDPEDADDERDDRAAHRDHHVHAEHLAHLIARDTALGQDHRGEDLEDRQHAADLGRHERGAPRDPPEARVDGGGQVHEDDHHGHHERVLREVEGELDRPHPAQQHHDQQAGQHGEEGVRAARKDDRERQRDVGQRERVRAAPKLQLDLEALGDDHHQSEGPPGDLGPLDRLFVADHEHVERDGARCDHGAQPPHRLNGGQLPTRRAGSHVQGHRHAPMADERYVVERTTTGTPRRSR
jgi:hypothetical protein